MPSVVNLTLWYTYAYSVPVRIVVTDKFGTGFPVTITRNDNATICTCTANGVAMFTTTERSYVNAMTWYKTTMISTRNFTIRKDTAASFTFTHPSFDSTPTAHVATLVTHLRDSLGRSINDVECRVTGIDGTWSAMTNDNGNATITGIYWGNSTGGIPFTVSWWDGATQLLSVPNVYMLLSKSYYMDRSIGSAYTFKDLAVAFNFTDKNNDTFPAFVYFYKNGVVPAGSGAAGANGYYQT
jgi:hypothetical protein